MAHYGIQAAITAKTLAKRAPNLEKCLLSWIYEVVGEPMPENIVYEEALKDGVLICKLMNKVKPGSIDKVRQFEFSMKIIAIKQNLVIDRHQWKCLSADGEH